jgi:hypothetical protein
MAEVAGSVGIVEAGTTPAPSGNAAVGDDGNGKGFSFVDGESGADSADAILDEVLTGEAPAEGDKPVAEAPAEGEKTPPPAAAAETPQAKQLRQGFAKLADERQKVLELQADARRQVQAAQQYAAKAEAHDTLTARLREDPAGVIAELGDEAVNKTLQGFIDREKSPAEREVAKLRAETERDKAARIQQEQERVAADWRNGIAAKVQADERFDLINAFNLHNDVIDVITSYYEKHSERDGKGNVTVPAILPWDTAAQAVEDNKAAALEKSKRYGKRAPSAPPSTPSAKTQAPAKRAPTSLSSVPVAEAPHREEDLPMDPDERERRILAEFGL